MVDNWVMVTSTAVQLIEWLEQLIEVALTEVGDGYLYSSTAWAGKGKQNMIVLVPNINFVCNYTAMDFLCVCIFGMVNCTIGTYVAG
jgi:hypothetical protein